MEIIPIFEGTSGLNNKIDPTRILTKTQTGLVELSSAVNIDIDLSGRIRRRQGYEERLLGNYHSLFSMGEYLIAVIGDALTIIEKDFTYSYIRNVTGNAKMSFVKVKNQVFYCNGLENGYVENRISYPWVVGEYVGPDTTREFLSPPVGEFLEVYNGIMYVARGNVIWHSEPFAYSAFDLARNYFIMQKDVLFMKAVVDGLYVGTEDGVSYFAGEGPKVFKPRIVSRAVTVKHTVTRVDGSFFGQEELSRAEVLLIGTNEGICVAGVGGDFRNLTEDKLVYPSSSNGAGIVYNDKFVMTLDS